MKQCRICGRIFEPFPSNRQLCSDGCVAESIRRNSKKQQETKKQRNRERLGIRICLECGKEFAPRSGTQVCCGPVCQDTRTKVLARNWKDMQREKEQAEKAAKKKRKKAETLAEINAKARAAGMTYGKYMAYIGCRKEQE